MSCVCVCVFRYGWANASFSSIHKLTVVDFQSMEIVIFVDPLNVRDALHAQQALAVE